jgi:hypothetical protein
LYDRVFPHHVAIYVPVDVSIRQMQRYMSRMAEAGYLERVSERGGYRTPPHGMERGESVMDAGGRRAGGIVTPELDEATWIEFARQIDRTLRRVVGIGGRGLARVAMPGRGLTLATSVGHAAMTIQQQMVVIESQCAIAMCGIFSGPYRVTFKI